MESQKRLTPKGNIVICTGLFEYSGDNEVCKVIPTQSIYNMKVSKVYPLLIYKVVKKAVPWQRLMKSLNHRPDMI